jgi:hypothetical protein
MIKQSRFDSEGRLLDEGASERSLFLITRAEETVFAKVPSCPASVLTHLGHSQSEVIRIFVHKVPGVTRELALYALKKTCGPEKMKLFFTAQRHSKQSVEPDKMIHVSMSHKHVGNFKKIS